MTPTPSPKSTKKRKRATASPTPSPPQNSKKSAPSHSSSSAASSKDIKANIKRVSERHEASALVQHTMEQIDAYHERHSQHRDAALFGAEGTLGTTQESVFALENADMLQWGHLAWSALEDKKRQREQQWRDMQQQEQSDNTAPTQQINQALLPMTGFSHQEPIKTHEINAIVPASLLTDPSVLHSIFTPETLRDKLTEDERKFLARYLPPDVNMESVFEHCTKFGENQVDRFVQKLSNGELHPLIYQHKMHLRYLQEQKNRLHKAMVENYIKAEIHERFGTPSQHELEDQKELEDMMHDDQ